MSEEKMLLGVASSPHVSSPTGTRSLMLDVLIALVPAMCAAVFFFALKNFRFYRQNTQIYNKPFLPH